MIDGPNWLEILLVNENKILELIRLFIMHNYKVTHIAQVGDCWVLLYGLMCINCVMSYHTV